MELHPAHECNLKVQKHNVLLSSPKETQQLVNKFSMKLKYYKQMTKLYSDNEYGLSQ